MNEPILQVKNLTTCLRIDKKPIAIVDNLSFTLFPGKTLALVGESGCGKSLTALSLLRILPTPPSLPSTGEVIYQKRNLLSITEKEMRKIRGAKISIIFQDPSSALNPVYRIGDQLMEIVELHLSLYGDAAFDRIIETLNEVGIPCPKERFFDYPHQLSGGMRQRIMIAMALISEPDILIADEPTTALDVTIQGQILDLISSIQKKRGMAVLLITHDMGVVAEIADDVIVMYAARGIEQSNAIALFDQMAHPYTKGLFASSPSRHQSKEKLYSIKGTVPSPQLFPSGCRFHPRCPYAMDKCKHHVPPSFLIGEKDHYASCWLYDKTEESAKKMGGNI